MHRAKRRVSLSNADRIDNLARMRAITRMATVSWSARSRLLTGFRRTCDCRIPRRLQSAKFLREVHGKDLENHSVLRTTNHWRDRLVQAQQRIRPHLSRTGCSTLDAVVGPFLSIAVSPVLLHSLGSRGFGLWAFAVAIAGLGGLASLGVGVAATKYVAEDLASGRPQGAVETTRAALSIALGGGLLLVALSAVFAPLLAGTAFARMGTVGEVSAALVLGVGLLALQEIDGAFTGALRGAQRFDFAAQVEISVRVVWIGAVIGAAWFTRDAIATLAVSNAMGILKAVVKGCAAQSALQGHCMIPTRSTASMLRLLRDGKRMWSQSWGGLLLAALYILSSGAILGAADLARYSICMQLARTRSRCSGDRAATPLSVGHNTLGIASADVGCNAEAYRRLGARMLGGTTHPHCRRRYCLKPLDRCRIRRREFWHLQNPDRSLWAVLPSTYRFTTCFWGWGLYASLWPLTLPLALSACSHPCCYSPGDSPTLQ